jgi:virulence-associated protein VapD
MKKEDLIAQLVGAKSLTSVVSIDSMLELLEAMEPEAVADPTIMAEDLIEDIMNQIESRLENASSDLVDLESAELDLNYDNRIEVVRANIDVYAVMQEIESVLTSINEIRAFDVEEEESDIVELERGDF